MPAVAWSLALLAAFLRWGGPVSLPWRSHRDGGHLCAAAHVATAAAASCAIAAQISEPAAAGAVGFALTIAGSWTIGTASRSALAARPDC